MKTGLRLCLLVFAFCLGTQAVSAQNTWITLSKVKYNRQFDEMMGIEVKTPEYSEEIIALQGKTVDVEGYIIPLKGERAQSHFMFSAYPYAMCYFCGGAGPETVMQVFMEGDEKVPYTSKKVKLKGKLTLSYGDINNMMYTLSNAEVQP